MNEIKEPVAVSADIYRAAESYKKIADYCLNESVQAVFPFLSNSAFSMELFLKSMLAYDYYAPSLGGTTLVKVDVDKGDKTHSLVDLFSKLDGPKQKVLKSYYQSSGMQKKYGKLGGNLKEMSHLFELSRYGYSQEELPWSNLSQIADFTNFFQQAVIEVESRV
ncbi:hypothetical protein ACNTOD_003888 [Vibrio navarrensis]